MASPLFDALHLKLSRKILDPVAAAATDGGEVTQALRTDYLNRANKFIQMYMWLNRRSLVDVYLQGLIKSQAIAAFQTAGVAVATDYSYWLTLKANSPAQIFEWMEPARTFILDMNANPNLANVFTIYGGKIFAYQSGAVLNTGAGTLFYIGNDQRASNGDTADIAIDPIWYEPIVDIAASYHFEDKGALDFAQANLKRASIILAAIGGNQT